MNIDCILQVFVQLVDECVGHTISVMGSQFRS